MKILQIGAYNRNIGDSIALYNIRKSLLPFCSNIEWLEHPIQNFWGKNNDPSYTIKTINNYNADLVIVGGGGLIEYFGYSNKKTGYKLPFNKEILQKINSPVIFYGVGVNEFRGNKEYSEKASNAIQEIIDHSAGFSVRNDGSIEKLVNTVKVSIDKVKVVPDPGLLFLEYLDIPKKSLLSNMVIQPSFNSNPTINKNRFNNKLGIFKKMFSNYNYLPHVDKDFKKVGKDSLVPSKNWADIVKSSALPKFLEYYRNIDGIVAMRGHGQLISIGANIPGIYFSTQDKLSDFSKLNGFGNYNVDINDSNWEGKVISKINNLKENKNGFLDEWYQIRESKLPEWYDLNNKFVEKYVVKFL